MTNRTSLVCLTLTIIVAGAALASTLVIYPRPHYLVFAIGTLILISGFAMDRLGNARQIRWLPGAAIATVSAAAVVLTIVSLTTSPAADKIYAESLRRMNASPTTWTLLTPERPIAIYLARGEQMLDPDVDVATFAELLEDNDVNAVFDGITLRQAEYAQLDGFEEFIENPESLGFAPVVPGSPFLVRE